MKFFNDGTAENKAFDKTEKFITQQDSRILIPDSIYAFDGGFVSTRSNDEIILSRILFELF